MEVLDVERSIDDQLALRRQSTQARPRHLATDGFVDDVRPSATARRTHELSPMGLGVIDAGIGAERANEFELRRRAGGTDHGFCTGPSCQLNEERPDSAGGCTDENRLAGRRYPLGPLARR